MPEFLALVAGLSFGFTDYMAGIVGRRLKPLATNAFVGLGAFAVALPVALLSHAQLSWRDFNLSLAAGIFGTAGFLLFVYLMAHKKMSIVTPITSATNALTPIAYSFITGSRPHTIVSVGIVLAVVGIVLLSMAEDPNSAHDTKHAVSLSLLAGLGFGTLSILLHKTSTQSGLWPAAVINIPPLFFLPFVIKKSLAPKMNWVRIDLALGVVIGLVLFALTYALQHGNLAIVAALQNQYPITAVFCAYWWQHERLQPWQKVGFLCSLCAITIINVG